MGILGDASGKLRSTAPENERFFADSKKWRYELDSRTGSPGSGITGVEWNGSQVRRRDAGVCCAAGAALAREARVDVACGRGHKRMNRNYHGLSPGKPVAPCPAVPTR